MARAEPPFGPQDAVVKQRPSRQPWAAPDRRRLQAGRDAVPGAVVHTPDWERIVVVSPSTSAELAAERAENLALRASTNGVTGTELDTQPRSLRIA